MNSEYESSLSGISFRVYFNSTYHTIKIIALMLEVYIFMISINVALIYLSKTICSILTSRPFITLKDNE